MASITGKKIKISVFGESHGEAIGVVIDGFPAGMKIDMDMVGSQMARRAPGGELSTARSEADEPRIVSGVSDGYSNGYPICAMIMNTSQRSSDYKNVKERLPRPSHADYPAMVKYGKRVELSGGGHFSGRLTAPVVFAGALCMQFLSCKYGIETAAHLRQILNVTDTRFGAGVTASELREMRSREFPTIDRMTAEAFRTIIGSAKGRGDSVGAVIECAVASDCGIPVGVGEHMFDSVEAKISSLMFGIPGVKGVEFGAGFDFCRMYGSEANDAYEYRDGRVVTKTDNCGGVAGGMTTGMPVIFSVAMKPTPSIFVEQDTVDLNKKTDAKLTIKGRHDPCIALRAVPVVESAAAIAMADLILDSEGRKL